MATKKQQKADSFIIFKLKNEYFAINVKKVIRILEMQKITEVPESPIYMKGVINIRGDILPVLDSRIKFGMGEVEITMTTCILVLKIIGSNNKIIKIGILVDNVDEVIQITEQNILPPPNIGEAYKSKYIIGMYNDDKKLIMLLDIDKLLLTNEIIYLNENKSEIVNV